MLDSGHWMPVEDPAVGDIFCHHIKEGFNQRESIEYKKDEHRIRLRMADEDIIPL